MADDKISVEIVLDNTTIEKGFIAFNKKAKESSDEVSKYFSSGAIFSGFKANLAGLAATAVGVGATIAGALFSKASINAAIEQEDAINRLNVALASTGKYSEESSKSIQEYANALQSTTKFADDAILNSAALIQTLGNLSETGLKSATAAALDLSSALKIDLNSATTLIGKAAAGNIAAFSRYGIEVKKGATDTETFANALRALQDKGISGSAAAQVNTYSGAIAQLGNIFGDLQEEFGNLVVKSPTVISSIKFISSEITLLTERFKSFTGSKDIFKPMVLGFIEIGAAINSFVVMPLEILSNVAFAVFKSIQTGTQVIIVAFAEVGNAIIQVLDLVGLAPKSLAESTQQFLNRARENLSTFAGEANTALGNSFDTSLTTSLDNFLLKYQETVINAEGLSDRLKNALNKPAEQASEKYKKEAEAINKAIQSGVINSMSVGIQAIGASLIKGSKAFEGFGKQVLGIIGDMAIQIGTTLISIGIGIDALKASLLTLSGGAAIAAGFALIAIGGLLKSLSGGAGMGGTASSATATDGGPGTTQPGLGDVEPTNAKAKTEISISIGNVLGTDQRTLAASIADVLNEAFDSEGITVRGIA